MKHVFIAFHANCLDGVTSANLVRLAHPDYEHHFVEIRHSDSANESRMVEDIQTLRNASPTAKVKVYCVDCTLQEATLAHLLAHYNVEIMVIDHHKSAVDKLQGVYSYFKYQYPNKFDYWFNTNTSAAVLTYIHLFERDTMTPSVITSLNGYYDHYQVPMLLRHIADRDCWLWIYPNSKYVAQALLPFTKLDLVLERFPTIEDYRSEKRLGELVHDGITLYEKQMSDVRRLATKAVFHDIRYKGKTYRAASVNANPSFTSDVCNHLIEKHDLDIAVGFYFESTPIPKWAIGIRSRDGFDSLFFAKEFNGGGHPQASGCMFLLEQFEKYLNSIVEKSTVDLLEVVHGG